MRVVRPWLLFMLLVLGGCASGNRTELVDLMDPGRASAITVSNGGSVELELVEKPSTGWTWKQQSSLDGILRADGDRFIRDAARDGMVGVGGKRIFTYTALKTGQVSMEFALVGPGQPVKPADHRMHVTIDVTD